MKIKRSIISLLVAGLFAGAGASVLAQDGSVGDQAKAEGDFNKRPGVIEPSTPGSNDDAARDRSQMNDQTAKEKGSADDQAKAEGDFNKRAGVIEPSTPGSNDSAARDSAQMNDQTAKEKGSADDQAKAEGDFNKRPGVIEPSTPNSKDSAARDKAEMDYQTAKEQCDSLTGAAKRTCNKDAFAARKETLKQWNGPGAMNETDPSVAGDEKADSGNASNQNQARTN